MKSLIYNFMTRFNFFQIFADEYTKAKVEQQVNKVHQISVSSNFLSDSGSSKLMD